MLFRSRVLASRPSNISELFRSVDDIVKKLNTLDIVEISDSLNTTLNRLDQSLQDFDAKGISSDIKTSLTSINKSFDPEKWDKLMINTSALIARTEMEVESLSRYILVVGQYLEKASSNLDQTLEQISIQPSQLLFSEPPIEKEFEKSDK